MKREEGGEWKDNKGNMENERLQRSGVRKVKEERRRIEG